MKTSGNDRGNVGPGRGFTSGAGRVMPVAGSGGGGGRQTMKPGPGSAERSQGKPPGKTGMAKPIRHEAPKADIPVRRKAPTQKQKL